jgi:hypothetical protein
MVGVSLPDAVGVAVLGFGWAAIPCCRVMRFTDGTLNELDAVWSRQRPLGLTGAWLLQHMLYAPSASTTRAG